MSYLVGCGVEGWTGVWVGGVGCEALSSLEESQNKFRFPD